MHAALLCPLALVQSPAPELEVYLADPVVLVDNYELAQPNTCAGLPPGDACYDTLTGIYYPEGQGPHALGYSNPPSPVFVQLRLGNGNQQLPDQYSWFHNFVLPHGYVGVDPHYPAVVEGQDYKAPIDEIAYLIQYLRHYHEWLNIDPERIFVFGRSFGAVMSMAVGLREDLQDLASADPILHQSSRPNFLVPFSGMADINCMGAQLQWDFLFYLWFPDAMAPGASYAQKQADSPIHWLLNPQLFARTSTPPMFLGYDLSHPGVCGQLSDPHDGYFGVELRDGIDTLALATQDAQLGLRSELFGTNDVYGFGEAMLAVMDWADEQLQPPPQSIYLVPPKTPIGPAGSNQQFDAIGAQPGHTLYYFASLWAGPIAPIGCANIDYGLISPLYLGSALANAQGSASIAPFAPPFAVGLDLYFHAVDLASCAQSQVLHKRWLE